MTPSRSAATSTWFSTTMGPEATKAVSSGKGAGTGAGSAGRATGAAAATRGFARVAAGVQRQRNDHYYHERDNPIHKPLLLLASATSVHTRRAGCPPDSRRDAAATSSYHPNFYHPNQDHSLDQIQMAGRRKSTFPAGLHPVTSLARPCMPSRMAPSGLDTATRAKKTRSDPCTWLLGLTTVTTPWKVRVGNPSSFTEAFSPG